jgi:hypothetical protein
MSSTWRSRVERILHRGEIAGICLTITLLFLVEFCFVYWLHRIPTPDAAQALPTFIAMPPWYHHPRFEVTLLLTIVAGLLFSICQTLWDLRRKRTDVESWRRAAQTLKLRVRTTISVMALAGCELALVSWFRS